HARCTARLLAPRAARLSREPGRLHRAAEARHGAGLLVDHRSAALPRALRTRGREPMTFDPQRTYLALHGAGEAKPIAVDDSFWPDVMAGKHPELEKGWLVGAFPMEADWPAWEMHPEGEEVLTLLSGEIEMIVEEGGAESRIVMKPGRTFVMPRGAWHRA